MRSKLALASFLATVLVMSATPIGAAAQTTATYDVVMSQPVGAGLRTDCGSGPDRRAAPPDGQGDRARRG